MKQYCEGISEAIYESFSENVSEEMLMCLYDLLDKTKTTTTIFDEAFPQLTDLIGEGQVDALIIKVIAELVNGSPEKAQENFDSLFDIVNTIIHEDDNLLLPEAVFLMRRLFHNCLK